MHKKQTNYSVLSWRNKNKHCNLIKGIFIFEIGDGVPPSSRSKICIANCRLDLADDSYFNAYQVRKNLNQHGILCTNP